MLSRRFASLVPVLALALLAGCAAKKQTYTVPQVTSDIEGAVRRVTELKSTGKLEQASRLLLTITRRVLSEFPEATITQEPVKKLLDALDWMANLCLDRSLELKNEAVSSSEDKLSRQFRVWADEHRDNLVKLRKLLPSFKSAQVAPRPGGPTGEPKGKGQPRPAEPPRDGMAPGGAAPGGATPPADAEPAPRQ